MQIFDFTVNTQNATKEDFDNAVDVLRYVDYICGWSNNGYEKSDVPSFLSGAFFDNEDDEITAKDFEIIIKSIYVFIERCYDFYPPTSNFMFPYRKYNMQTIGNNANKNVSVLNTMRHFSHTKSPEA